MTEPFEVWQYRVLLPDDERGFECHQLYLTKAEAIVACQNEALRHIQQDLKKYRGGGSYAYATAYANFLERHAEIIEKGDMDLVFSHLPGWRDCYDKGATVLADWEVLLHKSLFDDILLYVWNVRLATKYDAITVAGLGEFTRGLIKGSQQD